MANVQNVTDLHMSEITNPAEPSKQEAPDPFDLNSLYLSSEAAISVRQVLTIVPVRRPGPHTWVRVHPQSEYQTKYPVALFELRDDQDTEGLHLVDPRIAAGLTMGVDVHPYHLFTTISSGGTLTLWPIRMPGPDGKWHEAHRSSLDAAHAAQEEWTRIRFNKELGAYEQKRPDGEIPEPRWPSESFSQIVEIGFRVRRIRSHDHPLLKRLRGDL